MFRTFLATALCVVAAAPAAAQITRVSVSTAGVEADRSSYTASISANGRFVVFASDARNLVADDTNLHVDIFLRDRDTDADGILDESDAVSTTRISVGPGGAQLDSVSRAPAITPDGRYVVFLSGATNILPGLTMNGERVYRLDRMSGTIVLVSATPSGDPTFALGTSPLISDDGNLVAFVSRADSGLVNGAAEGLHVYVRNISAATTTLVAEPADWAALPAADRVIKLIGLSADGSRVGYLATVRDPFSTLTPLHTAAVVEIETGAITAVPPGSPDVRSAALPASGSSVVFAVAGSVFRHVVATGAATPALDAPGGSLGLTGVSPSARYALTPGRLHDFTLGVNAVSNLGAESAAFSSDRWLAISSLTSSLVAGDTNGVNDIFVVDLPDFFDTDDDTMDDRWETLFSVTDPAADPDADGQTNAQEEAAGTHPNGQVRRFLAEGATGTFFHTAIALANPSPTLAATAVLTFDRGDGTRVRMPVGIPAGRSVVIDAGAVTGLETADVSTTVESDRLLGVERSMTWGASASAIYGSHSETATTTPSATWFLAEGLTVLGFDLFYLLQNPQATTTHATVRFLLPSGTIVTRTYDLAPGSRTTIYVNQVAGLDETDVSGDISADAPIVVERAMYRGAPGQPFALGTDSLGVPAAATSWFMAEGATGSFFDLYVLIANPGNSDATVQALYGKPDGSTVTQTYTVRAHSRFSVYVDAIPGLENTSVATTLTSTNAVPIVAERAMYWPGGFFDYYEGHSSAGSTTTALEWVVSGGAAGGADAAQTFVLVANTANAAGEATLTVLPDRGFTGTVPTPIVVALPANSRTTVPITAVDGAMGLRVVSTGGAPVPLVVESAVYRSAGGVTWSSGSNALATPVP